ncbi:MAG: hypothetical protein ABUS79_20310 [Pseudomonadota bacterium]
MKSLPSTSVARYALLCLVAPVVVACGGGQKTIPLTELGAAVTDVICSRYARCGVFPSKASCVGVTTPQLEQLKVDVASGKIIYDGKAAADCLDAIGNQHGLGSCSVGEQLEAQKTPPACEDAFAGTVAAGGVCLIDEECVSLNCEKNACPIGTTTCCAGTCAAPSPPPVALGGDCSAAGAECVDRAYCKSTGAVFVCVGKTAAGQPCTDFLECASGYICGVDPAAPSTCARVPRQGEACNLGVVGLGCDSPDNYCDPTTRKCTRKVAPGAPCATGVLCVEYASCDGGAATCVARAVAGEPCANAAACLPGLQCVAGTCAPTPVRAACQ